jgi:hypothetical protein
MKIAALILIISLTTNAGCNFSADENSTESASASTKIDIVSNSEVVAPTSESQNFNTTTDWCPGITDFEKEHYETGRIHFQGNDVLFIPELAFGRCYKIKNKADFKNLNGEKIIAFGKTINASEFEITKYTIVEGWHVSMPLDTHVHL